MKIGGQTHRDGLVKSKCRHGRWFWDFYATEHWDRQSENELAGRLPSYWLEINRIESIMQRTGETVTFPPCTLIFACENDAVNFTGEVRDQ